MKQDLRRLLTYTMLSVHSLMLLAIAFDRGHSTGFKIFSTVTLTVCTIFARQEYKEFLNKYDK